MAHVVGFRGVCFECSYTVVDEGEMRAEAALGVVVSLLSVSRLVS